ncbi:MAG TPA: metallophosphoesterase family protein [Anaeromyxobacteraceae bacterium]|nr:metallophosphoesterase family protein [Anaeromyxobacteraceae bacterium]
MRVLVVSDIHGNTEALRAVATAAGPVDRIVCLGDTVDYGPRPVETVRWIMQYAESSVRGNHDNAVAFDAPCRSAPAFRRLSEESRKLTVPMLGEGERAFLAGLPETAEIEVGGLRLALVHAAPSDPLFRYLRPSDVEAWRREVEPIDADLILVGHTHLPMVLDLGNKLVVNPGSVGLPRDGDPRAAYAILDGRTPRLGRVAYDVDATVRDLKAWGLPDDVQQGLEGVYRTGSLG